MNKSQIGLGLLIIGILIAVWGNATSAYNHVKAGSKPLSSEWSAYAASAVLIAGFLMLHGKKIIP